eukprot:scaffold60_cov325-Pavlova_lutheri.AAC.26
MRTTRETAWPVTTASIPSTSDPIPKRSSGAFPYPSRTKSDALDADGRISKRETTAGTRGGIGRGRRNADTRPGDRFPTAEDVPVLAIEPR